MRHLDSFALAACSCSYRDTSHHHVPVWQWRNAVASCGFSQRGLAPIQFGRLSKLSDPTTRFSCVLCNKLLLHLQLIERGCLRGCSYFRVTLDLLFEAPKTTYSVGIAGLARLHVRAFMAGICFICHVGCGLPRQSNRYIPSMWNFSPAVPFPPR